MGMIVWRSTIPSMLPFVADRLGGREKILGKDRGINNPE
jgi:hypothetical protein